jgi:hypothetical protein
MQGNKIAVLGNKICLLTVQIIILPHQTNKRNKLKIKNMFKRLNMMKQ